MEAGENMLEFSGQLNLEKLAAYGPAVQIFAIWLEPKYYPIAMRQTVKYLDYYLEQMERYKERVGMVKGFSDILENKKQGRLSAIISLEGGEALEGEIAALRMFHRLGVRLMTLTWNHSRRCSGKRHWRRIDYLRQSSCERDGTAGHAGGCIPFDRCRIL